MGGRGKCIFLRLRVGNNRLSRKYQFLSCNKLHMDSIHMWSSGWFVTIWNVHVTYFLLYLFNSACCTHDCCGLRLSVVFLCMCVVIRLGLFYGCYQSVFIRVTVCTVAISTILQLIGRNVMMLGQSNGGKTPVNIRIVTDLSAETSPRFHANRLCCYYSLTNLLFNRCKSVTALRQGMNNWGKLSNGA